MLISPTSLVSYIPGSGVLDELGVASPLPLDEDPLDEDMLIPLFYAEIVERE